MRNDVDLHMHSLYSDDGQYTPRELAEMCYQAGIKVMAVADHNWVKANKEAQENAERLGMTYIPAIEIDCTYKGVNLHVVGYGIDWTCPAFNQLGENILKQELSSSKQKVALTNALGFDVDMAALKQLSSQGVYTGEMFAEVLLNDPRYKQHVLLQPYRPGGSRSDNPYVNFYWDYYSQGKPCYTEITYPSLEQIIHLIKEQGGVSVLAHPGVNLKGHFEWLDEMVQMGLQGVECFSSYHSAEVCDYFYQKAKALDILFTCGSDFHGKTKPAIELGNNGCTCPEEVKENLKRYHLI